MIKRLIDWANENEGLIGLIGVVLTLVGLLVPWIIRLNLMSIAPTFVDIIQQYKEIVISIGISLVGLMLVLVCTSHRKRIVKLEEKIQVLENLPEILLDETASANLSTWSFGTGQWTSDQDGLSVTKSVFGGFCKIGATWENYEFTFDFKIMDECAAWIVRAKSDSHFVMVQCNNKQIRPHILSVTQAPDGTWVKGFQLIKESDHSLSLREWNRVKTTVSGHSIKVWINDTLVWSDSELLKDFAMGTVGFRCSRDEHAFFRSIKVLRR